MIVEMKFPPNDIGRNGVCVYRPSPRKIKRSMRGTESQRSQPLTNYVFEKWTTLEIMTNLFHVERSNCTMLTKSAICMRRANTIVQWHNEFTFVDMKAVKINQKPFQFPNSNS